MAKCNQLTHMPFKGLKWNVFKWHLDVVVDDRVIFSSVGNRVHARSATTENARSPKPALALNLALTTPTLSPNSAQLCKLRSSVTKCAQLHVYGAVFCSACLTVSTSVVVRLTSITMFRVILLVKRRVPGSSWCAWRSLQRRRLERNTGGWI